MWITVSVSMLKHHINAPYRTEDIHAIIQCLLRTAVSLKSVISVLPFVGSHQFWDSMTAFPASTQKHIYDVFFLAMASFSIRYRYLNLLLVASSLKSQYHTQAEAHSRITLETCARFYYFYFKKGNK